MGVDPVSIALIVGAVASAGVGAAGAAGAFDKEIPEPDLKVPEEAPIVDDDILNKEARRQRVLANRRVGTDALVVPINNPGLNIP